MRDKYMKQLENLNNNMIEMGAMIEKSIENAISALVRQDVETAKKAIEYDAEIDEMEKNIELANGIGLGCRETILAEMKGLEK